MKKYITSIFALGVAALAGAQGLNKEITIEKEIVPEQRAATRLPVTHSVITPKVSQTAPSFSSRGVTAGISPEMTLLDPAVTGDSLIASPYRGYLSLGYFPAYNLGASAGYRFIDNQTTMLGAWGQFNGYSYNRHPLSAGDGDYKTKVADNSVTIGVDFSHHATETGVISANLDFGYGKNNVGEDDLWNRSATQFHLDAGWKDSAGDLNYNIGAFGGYFGNSFAGENHDPFNQTTYGGTAGVEFAGASLDVYALLTSLKNGDNTSGIDNPGLVSFNPAYTFHNNAVMVHLGLKADISIRSGKSFRVAPDVRIEYRPDPLFAFYVAADGGVKVNTMETLYDYSHFTDPCYFYGNSYIPFDLSGGFVIGPFRGGSLEIFGGYAKADDWLMTGVDGAMAVEDVRGWHAGARLSYSFRDILRAKASVEMAPSSGNKAYYLWRDRAKTVADISVEVRPITPLTLEAGWELRSGRTLGETLSPEDSDLGTVSNLRFGAAYRITDPFTIFARGENLLGKKWDILGSVPANGLCGLVGVSYKF
ncbi:MAG: hypothetical protein K2M07_04245 [Muribaculaceae bacterium]|nr:hypothetical protein [Muribaculaceae bacterium]